MMEDESGNNEIQCSYCGKWIYEDTPCCPKCGNYTDGKGPYERPERDGRPLPRIYVIMGWLVLIAILAPLLLTVVQWFSK